MSTMAGAVIILGVQPMRPIMNLPDGLQRMKVRMRPSEPVKVFLKTERETGEYFVQPADNKSRGCPEWLLVAAGLNLSPAELPARLAKTAG